MSAVKEDVRVAFRAVKSSSDLLSEQTRRESSAVSYPKRIPIAIASASGSYIHDIEGRRYIDFLTGAGVLPLGHNPPALIDIARDQLGVLVHGLDFPTPAKSDFIEAHLSMLPESLRGKYRIHLCGPTGADAVEAAIKLAKLNTGGGEVISFFGGYHGCTQGALSLTTDRDMKRGLSNLLPGVHYYPYSYCYACPFGLERASCKDACANYFARSMKDSHNGIGDLAAVIMECVQGEGGAIPVSKALIQEASRFCQENGVPLIVDEVQTGCGRTGTWFAFEQYDIEPDIIVMSKAVSGIGTPCSFILYKERLNTWPAGKHIGTFRGNNIAFATGAEFVNEMKSKRILENVRSRSDQVVDALGSLAEKHRFIGDVRGRGLLLGMEIVDPESKERSPEIAKYMQKYCLDQGLIVELGGRNSSVVRLLPPLNVSQQTVADALDIIMAACEAVSMKLALDQNSFFFTDYVI
ncbi:MAG: diaminobutyrate--2-oxoglutarate transaminase family protein [Gammaproteobacteria bacterium]|nr:diaminobutyrate--2-oxoglutarate transaminase family protein [Gammaproteobacteria bacterium]MBQ0775654.1 diaminobutyrate--2-oxoglutarate transaminase family protein [Gammaproteobacteria bacterium]